jgi:diguanylate cyclase (GGDEF)-like protein
MLVVASVLLFLLSLVVAAVNQRRQIAERRDLTLSSSAKVESARLSDFFESSRTAVLLLAKNVQAAALAEPIEGPADAEVARVGASAALGYVEELYPGRIGEACLISRAGAEVARVVHALPAAASDLSQDEAQNPFFAPTIALEVGQVYQAAPYVSPDTGDWVLSNSTPVIDSDGTGRFIVHYEVTINPLVRDGRSDGRHVYIVERDGTIVADSNEALSAGAPRSQDRRLRPLFAGSSVPSFATIGGERLAIRPVAEHEGNDNHWYIAVAADSKVKFADTIALSTLLMVAVALALGSVAVRTIRESQRRLRREALTDSLTGLPNRAKLLASARDMLPAATRRGNDVVVMLVDLDHFKEVNDTLGHLQGDNLLREVSARFASAVGSSGTLARLGGDEFAVVSVAATGSFHGVELAEKMIDSLAAPMWLSGVPVRLAASIGIALFPEHGTTIEVLLQHADTAMYQAKGSGSDYRTYSGELDSNRPEQLALAAELRDAIGTDQLQLVYQPKFDLVTDAVVGFEALARWQHPAQGAIGPGSFIALAEKSGLIHTFSTWALRTALIELASWQDAGRFASLSVNVSPTSITNPTFVKELTSLLHDTGADPSGLILELTEGTFMRDYDRSVAVLNEVRRLGIKVSIDDYGTGYSGLSYLRQLPIGEVKIDRSFVCGIATNASDRSIVSSTIDLAHQLGLRVVAEGVETVEVLDSLRAMGCDEAQGFLLGMPTDASIAVALMSERGTKANANE